MAKHPQPGITGIYTYIDGRYADVFRFYPDGTYLYTQVIGEVTYAPPDLSLVPTWLTRDNSSPHLGNGTYTLNGNTLTFQRIAAVSGQPINYKGIYKQSTIVFEQVPRAYKDGEHINNAVYQKLEAS